jgi:hypothetical protein
MRLSNLSVRSALVSAVALATLLAACSEDAVPPARADAVVDIADTALDSAGLDSASGSDVTADTAAVCDKSTWKQTFDVNSARSKFAVSLFHYNIEYVIGGLEMTLPDGSKKRFLDKPANAGWDNEKTEDYIVRETLLPILQMYDKHPGWGVDIELQAYMVEVMADRHPETLDLLRKLAQRGQVEVVSFHYAAQLFMAFSKEDQVRSLNKTKAIFEQHCLPLSGVVFNQEGQAGEGRQALLLEQGWKIGVFPKNLWRYAHKNAEPYWPLYSSEGGDLIVGPGGIDPTSGIQLAWNFLDDGELRAVGETSAGPYNPYFAPDAPHDPKRVAEFEAELAKTEQDGFYLTTISNYVAHVKERNVKAKAAPPLLDGTWQAPSTASIKKWLGGSGIPFGFEERDANIRAGNALASQHLRALELLTQWAKTSKGVDTAAVEAALPELWKDLWHAEVSDCTGINPWLGEVMFGLGLNAQIEAEIADHAKALLTAAGAAHAQVDLQSKTVTPLQTLPVEQLPEAVEAPIDITLTGERLATPSWVKSGDNRWRLEVDIAPATEDSYERLLMLDWPRYTDAVSYSPALIEDQVRTIPLSAFQFLQEEAWLPLANGLIGLGNGWWVIKHVTQQHIAARIAPADKFIRFQDETTRPGAMTWRFELFQGEAKDALTLANRINITPVVTF